MPPRDKQLRVAPPEYLPLDEERRARAVAAMADLLARYLKAERRVRTAKS